MDSNLECSANVVAKTDACTHCYLRICDTCQIRDDFLFQERSARSHRSELFIDEIYTCNKCDQTWMDLFSYCVTCSRLVCRSFKDKHEDCDKYYGLMESDIRKRRKLVETEKEIEQFAFDLDKNRNDLSEICEKKKKSNFLPILKSSVASVVSKFEDTINSFGRDSEILKSKLSSVEQYIIQQNESFQDLKDKMQHIRRKIAFPIKFLQELSEWEKEFHKLTNMQARFDLSALKNTPVINVVCRPKQLDQYFIHDILGIQKDPSRYGSCHSSKLQDTPVCYGLSVSNPADQPIDGIQVEPVQKRKTLPHLNKKYDPYHLHLLETEIKSKDDYIRKLRLDRETLKKHLYLLKNSRNSAEKKMKEITNQFEVEIQRNDQLHKEELQTVIDHKIQLEEDLREVKFKMEQQLQTQLKEYEELKARQGNHIHDLESDIEFLKLEAQKTEDASQKALNDAINENQKAEERIKQYIELVEIKKLQIEGLEDHVDLLKRGSHKITKETEEENQRIKTKLQKVKHMFNEWTKSSSSLNNMMAHELDLDDVFIESESGQQQRKQQTDTKNFDSHLSFDTMSSNSISASKTARENIRVNEDNTTHVCDVSSGHNTAKHITSVSYTAEHIHIIQNSQVSLADSGYDAKSITGEMDWKKISTNENVFLN
ncbi:desmoplakin-like [Mytilus trossulus]|uniref:desmoplakin-like n=1 Tax=Mytilus trossulus TaxID=6551 RepID=UPI003005BE8C